MAIATVESPEQAAPERAVVRPAHRRRRRWVAALVVSAALAALLGGVGGDGTARAGHGPTSSRGWEAWSERLAAEAEVYLGRQADVARGRAADAARLQAAADAGR